MQGKKGKIQLIREYKSPIRWAVIALFASMGLFCLEVSLSLYQIYLSFLEGVVEVAILNEVIAFVLFVLFGLAGLCILLVCGYFGLYWWRHPHETDDKAEILEAINRVAREVKTVKRAVSRAKGKVKEIGK